MRENTPTNAAAFILALIACGLALASLVQTNQLVHDWAVPGTRYQSPLDDADGFGIVPTVYENEDGELVFENPHTFTDYPFH